MSKTTTIVPLVGAFYRPAGKAILQCLPQAALLRLEAEPTNEYDPNAIKVLVPSAAIPQSKHQELDLLAAGYGVSLHEILLQEELFIGYIARDRAEVLAPQLDKVIEATLSFGADDKPFVKVVLKD